MDLEEPGVSFPPSGLDCSYVVFDRFDVGVVASVGPEAYTESGHCDGRS